MKYLLLLCSLFLIPEVFSQDKLQEYITAGLENNLALKQKEYSYRQSLEALKEARGMFYPGVSLNARYTISEGGRVIEFPVGDLINPVYSTLNQLTHSTMFPQIDNEEIKFLRPREHETKVRLIQPVFNTDLYYNAKIKKELSVSEEISIEQYKRELIAEIKKAYYTVGMTESLLLMLGETRLLLLENIKVNTKLVEYNKVTRDYIYRSQTELSKFEQQMQTALKNKKTAVAYFNFLLNRSLSDSVVIEAPPISLVPEGLEDNYTEQAVLNREEIKRLERYNHITDLTINLNRSAKLPDLLIVADWGFQGEKYRFNKDHDYLQTSVVLNWDLFTGFRNKAKVSQALLHKEMVERQLDEAKTSIQLQVINAYNELKASEAGRIAAENQVKSSREGFRFVRRKFEEGQANLLEFMDARNSLTQAEENLIITRFRILSYLADFEKVVANNKTF